MEYVRAVVCISRDVYCQGEGSFNPIIAERKAHFNRIPETDTYAIAMCEKTWRNARHIIHFIACIDAHLYLHREQSTGRVLVHNALRQKFFLGGIGMAVKLWLYSYTLFRNITAKD